jgi:hypothetical protein
VASFYRAKEAYESTTSQKASNVDQLATDLAVARKSERVAVKALEDPSKNTVVKIENSFGFLTKCHAQDSIQIRLLFAMRFWSERGYRRIQGFFIP